VQASKPVPAVLAAICPLPKPLLRRRNGSALEASSSSMFGNARPTRSRDCCTASSSIRKLILSELRALKLVLNLPQIYTT
jgi:hypothetical protein